MDAHNGLGLRERKKLRTRRDLQDAALRLFSRDGYEETTVDDIAAAADVSRRTFFRYFESKEDVLVAEQLEQLHALRDAFAARPADEPVLRAFREAAVELSGVYAADRERLRVQLQLIHANSSVLARHLEQFAEWHEQVTAIVAERMGVDPATTRRPALIVGCITGLLRVAVETWILSDGEEPLDVYVDEGLELLDEGLHELRPKRRRRAV